MKHEKSWDKMPEIVRNTMGTAQKRLTLLEGQARKALTGTMSWIMSKPSLKKVEDVVDQWRSRYSTGLELTPIRKRVEKLSTDLTSRAYGTIGLATKADIKTITRKIDRLRGEVRKLFSARNRTANQ